MSLLKRRSFVKTILATAASGSPACAAFYDGVSFRSPADTNTPSSTILENGAQQLRLSPVGTPLSFPNHTPSSEGDSAISRRQNRTSNHHLAEFNLHVDGRPVGKLAARRTHAADQELARRLWQRLACGLPSRSERWRRNHDVLRRERYGVDVD